MTASDQLLTSLVRLIEERRTEVRSEIQEKQKAAARRAEEIITELRQENTELQRRNAELGKLGNTEDHLHLLQVRR